MGGLAPHPNPTPAGLNHMAPSSGEGWGVRGVWDLLSEGGEGVPDPSPPPPLLAIGKKFLGGLDPPPPTTPGVWTPSHTSLPVLQTYAQSIQQ